MGDFRREIAWFSFTCEIFVEEMRNFQVKWEILVAKVFDFGVKMGSFLREKGWFSLKWVIFEEKMSDFQVKRLIFQEKMRDFRD